MSDLKAGTTIGGQIAWHGGNLDVLPSGNSLFFKSFKVYSENDKPSKADVELGNVQNLGIATQAQAQAGTSNSVYMTALRSKQQLDTHATLTNNPHSVTKAQVQLGNVENYGIASTSEATAGTVNNKYMTPLRNQDHFLSKTTTVTRALLLDPNEAAIRTRLNVAETGIAGNQVRTNTDLDGRYALTSRTITAGTGLSGGGNLTANRTLSVTYGTTAGTAAQGNDSRLSNSREWTASTVSQAEAEAGTATTRRAWTAQRVRQNVANYTQPFTSAEKTKLSGIAAGAQVNVGTNLGSSGTGATRTITSSTGSNTSFTYSAADVGAVPTGRTISAGTGLTGGGNLTANRTLSVTYGTTAGTAAQGNDSRLSNSREWTAATVSQAEAQAGTFATRRAWTAQRVRQNVAAYTDAFNSSGTYSGLRAQATTKADVGLSGIPNTNGSTANFLRGDGSWVTPPNTTYSAGTGLSLSGTTFNVNLGTTANTSAAGNDSRINNGQTAFGWGNHASAGYAFSGTGNSQVRNNQQLDARYSQTDTTYSAGDGLSLSGTTFNLRPRVNSYIEDSQGNPRIFLGAQTGQATGFIFRQSAVNQNFRWRDSSNTDVMSLHSGTGRLTANIVRGSDPKLKDVQEEFYLSLEQIAKLQVVLFKWKFGIQKGELDIGILANQVKEICPTLVDLLPVSIDDETGKEYFPEHMAVAYDKLAVLIGVSLGRIEYNKWYRRLGRWIKERL